MKLSSGPKSMKYQQNANSKSKEQTRTLNYSKGAGASYRVPTVS